MYDENNNCKNILTNLFYDMKKITLLFLSLLLLSVGGVKAQTTPTGLPNVTAPKAGIALPIYTTFDGWGSNCNNPAKTITISEKTLYVFEGNAGLGIPTYDVSFTDMVHLDIYVSGTTKIAFFLYGTGMNWRGVERSVNDNAWNSIDIPLSEYNNGNTGNITEFAFRGGVVGDNKAGMVDFSTTTTIYLANAYFYSTSEIPKMNATVGNITTTSVSFNVNGVIGKNATNENLIYNVSWTSASVNENKSNITPTDGKITIEGLTEGTEYAFKIKANDGYTDSKEKELIVSTKSLLSIPVADAVADADVKQLYYKNDYSTLRGILNENTTGIDLDGKNKERAIKGNTSEKVMAFNPSDETKVFGLNTRQEQEFNYNDENSRNNKIYIAVYVPGTGNKTIKVSPRFYGVSDNFTECKLTAGQWNYLKDINPFENYKGGAAFIGLAFTGITGDVYLDNFYMSDKGTDDGEDPVITSANTYTTTVASASFRLRATDNSDELSYKVVVEDEDGKKVSEETVKGGKDEDIYVSVKGLRPNTAYKAIVTVSDMTRTSEAKELAFITNQLTHAEKQASSKSYYENDKTTLRGMLNSTTTDVNITIPEDKQINIGDNDNVLMFPVEKDEVFGLNVLIGDEFRVANKENIVGIAVYPVGTTTIQVSPRIYGVEDKFENRPVKENEWNYITMKPLKDYDGGNAFVGVALKSAEKGTVFLDNFYMYTSKDVTAPTVTFNDINKDDVHVNSVKVSFSGADETNEEVKFDVWVKNITDNEVEYRGGFARAKNNEKVTYYLKGLKTGKKYEIYVKVRDFSENEGRSEVKTFTTKSYTDNISIESSKVKADNGGIVVLKGKWNVEEFNKIAAEYPYGCFDVRNVVFDDGLRHDRGPSGIQLFNHNAYFITDIGNNFDGNYAIPDEEGKLIGMNFQWYDGDFKPDGGPVDYVNYQAIIDDYKEKHGTDPYPGLSGSGYIKMDPYTGYDLYFKEQGASITRQMFMKTLAVGGTQGKNKYSTMICPFAMNTEKVENCEFFQLNEPSVSGENVTLNFTQVTGKTEANKPYLIRVKGDGNRGGTAYFVDNAGDTEKKLSFSDIKNKEEIYGKAATDNNVTATLFGTYVTKTFTPETAPKTSEVYGLKQDNDKLTLISSTKKSTLPAFRAAVKIKELPANAKNIILSFDGETTGISSVNNEEMTSILGNVYSIDGKKVASSRDALVTLPAGIYIVNGKKVVIK